MAVPEFTIRPDGLVTAGNAGWTGAYTDVDDSVDSHDGDLTYVERPINVGVGGPTFSLENPGGTAPYTKAKLRAVLRYVATGGVPPSEAGVDVRDSSGNLVFFFTADPPTSSYALYEATKTGSFTQAEVNGWRVELRGGGKYTSEAVRFTAIELVLTDSGSGAGNASLSWSDTVQFSDAWTVAGDGASTSNAWSDTVTFADTWALTSSGGGGSGDGTGGIATGRTDIACRTCGTIVQVTESLVFYADGNGTPVTWDGVSASATTVTGAPTLPYPVAMRNRVFLFGEQNYLTGTVQTTSGITTVQFSTAPPSTALGKAIAIDGVAFGTNLACQTTITSLNGVLATLAQSPNQNFPTAEFIVFGGSGGAQLRWSADGNHTTWTDAGVSIGPLDGDLATGAFALGGFLILAKRSKTYRFDYDFDPNDDTQRAWPVMSDSRGLVANRSAVVIEGTAYLMDAQPNYFWVTRGGANFPFDIGRGIRNVLDPGGEYEPDWGKSSCWFGWYSPIPKSVCWAFTKLGENYPRFAAEYMTPNIEGGDEPGRWSIREYHHYIRGAINAVGADGVNRPWLICADRDDPDSMFLAADSNVYGDMAKASSTGTVTKQTSNTVIQLPVHTAFQVGSLIEINGQTRTVSADDKVNVTVSLGWTVTVEGKKYRAGYRPRASFKTIDVSPEPGYGLVTIAQVACIYHAVHADSELKVRVLADGRTHDPDPLSGALSDASDFPKTDRLSTVLSGIDGYECSIQITLLSPGGSESDSVLSCDIVRLKETESPYGEPSD